MSEPWPAAPSALLCVCFGVQLTRNGVDTDKKHLHIIRPPMQKHVRRIVELERLAQVRVGELDELVADGEGRGGVVDRGGQAGHGRVRRYVRRHGRGEGHPSREVDARLHAPRARNGDDLFPNHAWRAPLREVHAELQGVAFGVECGVERRGLERVRYGRVRAGVLPVEVGRGSPRQGASVEVERAAQQLLVGAPEVDDEPAVDEDEGVVARVDPQKLPGEPATPGEGAVRLGGESVVMRVYPAQHEVDRLTRARGGRAEELGVVLVAEEGAVQREAGVAAPTVVLQVAGRLVRRPGYLDEAGAVQLVVGVARARRSLGELEPGGEGLR